MKIRQILAVVTFALLFLFASPSSRAQSMLIESNDWQFIAPTFYMWLFEVDGDVSVKGKTRDVDLSIGDVLQDSSSFQIYFEVDKGKWGGFVEPTFMSFDTENKDAGVKFKTDTDIIMVDAAGTYRLWETEDPKRMALYLTAGVRYWNYDIQVNGKGAAPKGSAHMNIIDPVIGARYRVDVSEKLHLGTRFDVGGFGIADKESHFTWQTWLLVGYDVTKRFSVFGGYRALGLNYDQNHGSEHKGVDVVYSGPVLGFNFDIFGWLADRKK